jgi:hypothetical protein
VLVRNRNKLEACRAVFGDDTLDYGEALKRHYEQGSPPNWPEQFISQYATTHPWEDFAETWAHYLHIVDTLEMVAASGMSVRPIVDSTGDNSATVEFDPYCANSIEQFLESWLPFVFAINSVSSKHVVGVVFHNVVGDRTSVGSALWTSFDEACAHVSLLDHSRTTQTKQKGA